MRTKPPESAEATLATLTEDFDGFSAQLQRAARFLIDHPKEIGVRSMRALAGMAEVHPNTLVRLAQAIGFEGYDALRERFRDFAAAGGLGGFRERADWLKKLAARGGSSEVIGEMAAATAENLETMWRRRSAKEMDAIADAILKGPRVFVLGMGSAYSLAHQFWYVARMALDHVAPIPHPGGQPLDDLARLRPSDVLMALTFQPYRAETMQAARRAQEMGVTVIGITDSLTSPLARVSDHLLTTPTHTPQFFQSHAAAIAMLEGLLAVLVSRAGDEALARIEQFHQQRMEAGLYEEPASLSGLG